MSLPAIQLARLTKGPDTIDPATSDGWETYEPLVGPEPESAGAPPVEPDLIESIGLPVVAREVRGRSGGKFTSGFRGRVTARVAWTNINPAQRLAVLVFLRDDCGGGEKAFDVVLDPDSETGAGTVRKFRAIADPSDTWVNKVNYTVAVECEEVYS